MLPSRGTAYHCATLQLTTRKHDAHSTQTHTDAAGPCRVQHTALYLRPRRLSHADSEPKQRSLSDSDFYLASNNPHGLHISAAGAMFAGQPIAIEVWVGGERGPSAEAQQRQQPELYQPTTLSRPATREEIARSNPKREQLHLSDHAPPTTTVSDTRSERLLQVAVPEITREIVKEVPKVVLKEVLVYKDKIVQSRTQQEVLCQHDVLREVPIELTREVVREVEVIREVVREVIVEKVIEKEVRVEVPVEVIREVIREIPVERIVERIVEKIVEVPKIVEVIKEVEVEKIVEKIVEVPVIVEVIKEVEVRVETPVFHDREVEVVKYLPGEIVIKEIEKLVREIVIREVPVEVIVTKEVAVEKIVYKIEQVTVETRVEVPVEVIVEVVREVPIEVYKTIEVERIVEVPYETIKEVVKEVPKEVIREVPYEVVREVVREVPVIKEVRVEVPVEVIRTIEKEVIKTVEVIREVPVEVERVVEVEKIVEVEVIKYVPVEVVREVVRDVPRVVELEVLREVPMGTVSEEVVERHRGVAHSPRRPKIEPLPERRPKPVKPGNRPKRRPKPVVTREYSDQEGAEPSSRARIAGGHKVWQEGSDKLNMEVFKGKFPWCDSHVEGALLGTPRLAAPTPGSCGGHSWLWVALHTLEERPCR